MIKKTSSKAILYHYFEANNTYRDNLIFFLARGWSADIDIYLILSSPCSVELPQYSNLHIIQTPNLNHDYGGYCHAVMKHSEIFATYDSLAFINCSVRGPFLPNYIMKSWYDVFAENLNNNTHLIGATYNSLPHNTRSGIRYANILGRQGPFAHIQTTAYVMSGQAFRELVSIGFYDHTTAMTKYDTIAKYEIGMSEIFKEKGWCIKSILSDTVFDYSDKMPEFHNFSARDGDPHFPNAYFGRTFGPDEVVFIKTNRALLCESTLASLTFSHLARFSEDLAKVWPEARDLFERSYFMAKNEHKAIIARQSGIRGQIIRRLKRWIGVSLGRVPDRIIRRSL